MANGSLCGTCLLLWRVLAEEAAESTRMGRWGLQMLGSSCQALLFLFTLIFSITLANFLKLTIARGTFCRADVTPVRWDC